MRVKIEKQSLLFYGSGVGFRMSDKAEAERGQCESAAILTGLPLSRAL